jgi:tetratricopeptide (TPR) repeat protein
MPQDEFRIFLSAVTSEFGQARAAVAADLRSRETLLRVQSDFRQEAGSDTTLKKLHDYICGCSAVVCVIGKRSGALPPPKAAEPFAHMLPSGITKASYTQWEFFFARHFKRRLSIYIADDNYQPDRPTPTGEDSELQRVFCDHIVKEQGLDRSYFANEDQLGRAVLKEDWPKKRTGKPIALPYPSLGGLFKGRDEFLKELHASLLRGSGRTVIVGSALYGLGGIGKTRAAVEYAWAHQDDYTALLFVIAETPEALRRNLAALAGPLVLNLPEQHATEEDERLKAVLDWLKLHPGWFLILDNVDTPEALEDVENLLLSRLTGGRVVVTSRLANFAGQFDPLELDVLGVEDAVAFLIERTERRRQKTPDDAATARQLAADLGELALALEQAGAYVARLGIPFSRYRELWRDNWDKVAGWSDERITKYPRAVAVTWQTSVNQLTPTGRSLLERLAWFAPEPIPNFLLEVPVPDLAADDFVDALANLADYSLARRNVDKQEFNIHRLVQDVTRRGLVGQERRRSQIEALAWVNAAFVGNPQDVRTWSRLDPLAPHVRMVAEHADGAAIINPTAQLMNHLGSLMRAKARFGEAESLYRRALAIDEASYGPNHPELAIRLNNFAALLQATNRLSEAEPLYRRALAISEASYGPDHPNVATGLNNLAALLRATNRLSEAEPLYRRALAILARFTRTTGHQHPNLEAALSNYAQALGELGRTKAEIEAALKSVLERDWHWFIRIPH